MTVQWPEGDARWGEPPEPAISPGKQVLLRALDSITTLEDETAGSVKYLLVAYAVVHRDEDGGNWTARGWDATDHPHFVHAGLLREVARRIELEAIQEDADEA